MKSLFARISLLIILATSLLSSSSCSKENNPDQFSIIGPWGMVSGTITNSDGTTNRYDVMGAGLYYEYMEFKVDGTLIRTALPSQEKKYGVYTYNDASKTLQYKYDGDKFYQPAVVNVISATEMNVTTDWGSVGRMTQYFVKVK